MTSIREGSGSAAGAAEAGGAAGVPLDPADWDAFRTLGHRMVDDMLENLRTVRDRPVWQPVPADVRARLRAPLPEDGVGEAAAYQEFVRDVLPYPIGNTHPRFWGWVIGSGTPLGALAEFLAATMNPNVSGIAGAPALVEAQTLEWLRDLLALPAGASGVLVSGGSMANLVGVAVGLAERAGFDVLAEGLAAAPRPPVLYASTQTHFSVAKAARLLGLGTAGVRSVPVDDDFAIDVPVLRRLIAEDRAAGRHPFAVVGNAGTVATGAFDDLQALADVAAAEDLWLHVDGAFGAFAALVPELAPLVDGMERADAVAFDLHKWMLMPYEVGAVLVRDAAAHRRAFAIEGAYVAPLEGGPGRYDVNFAERGPQLSRGFRALKVWLQLRAFGASAYREIVRRNVEQARYLAGLVDAHPALERLAPVPLNVVCFQYRGSSELNRALLIRLQSEGIAVPTHAEVRGRFAIRAAITNHRTAPGDLDLLIREVVRIGRELAR